NVEVTGHLTCPKNFKARANIWDDDYPWNPDALGGMRPYQHSNYNQTSARHEVFFKLDGTAEELWPRDNEVELVTTI
ncbi:hypothetical protein PMAYCL1PPCAC_22609, partial [Pristionchus mayeri]